MGFEIGFFVDVRVWLGRVIDVGRYVIVEIDFEIGWLGGFINIVVGFWGGLVVWVDGLLVGLVIGEILGGYLINIDFFYVINIYFFFVEF